MKKLVLAILLIIVSLFSMAACNSNETNDTINETSCELGHSPEEPKGLNDPTPISPLAKSAKTGELIPSEPAGFWLPPEDFLTKEEKEFRKQVIKAAQLDENSPNLEEQLVKLYSATNSSEYPNYETYKLFMDHLAN